MTTDPGYDPEKKAEVCPYCKEERGKEHKKSCGLWSPYSTSQWVKSKETPAAIVVQVHKHWPFPASMRSLPAVWDSEGWRSYLEND